MVNRARKLIAECFGKTFDPNKKYIIAIQGVSTSGKYFLAKNITKALIKSKLGCRPFIFQTNRFYDVGPLIMKKLNAENTMFGSYDYENPKALDWNSMNSCLKTFLEHGKYCKYSKYDTITNKRVDYDMKNGDYNVILVVGLYSHTLFNKFVFDINVLPCPTDSLKKYKYKNLEAPNFNYHYYRTKARILPIFLNITNKKIMENRKKIDQGMLNLTAQESEDYTKKYVVRASDHWVEPFRSEHAIYVHYNNDANPIIVIIKLLLEFFCGAKINYNEVGSGNKTGIKAVNNN